MGIETKRFQLLVTSLTLAGLALTAVMVALFGFGAQPVAAERRRALVQPQSDSVAYVDEDQASVLVSTSVISVPGDHETIQKAIDAASAGDTIMVASGTYTQTNGLSIDKSLTIVGVGPDETRVEISRTVSGYGVQTSGDTNLELVIRGMTLQAVDNVSNFFFHIAHNKAFTLENATVVGMGKDYYSPGDETWENTVGGVNLINIENGALKNVTVRETSRNAVSFSAVKNILMEDIIVEDSGARGGSAALAIYLRDDYADNNPQSISFDGGDIAGAPIGINLGDSVLNVVSGDDIQNVNFTNNAVQAIASPGEAEALLVNNTFDRAVVVRGSDIQLPVIFSAIQDAIEVAPVGHTIDVAPGTYTETVQIDKRVELVGANAGLCAGAGPAARGSESIVDAFWIKDGVNDVTIDGFHVTGADFAGGTDPKAIYVQGSDHKIKNNVISGPGADLSTGRGVVFETGDADGIDVLCNEIHGWLSGVFMNLSSGHLLQSNAFHDNSAGIGSDGLSDVEIRSNVFNDNIEGFGAGNVLTNVVAHLNSFTGNTKGIGHYGGQEIDATDNWWGCNDGPDEPGCDTITGTVDVDPWLVLDLAADPMRVFADGGTADLTASLTTNSDEQDTSGDGYVPDGITTTFAADLGSVTPTVTDTVDGLASATYVAPDHPTNEVVSATVHNETVTLTLTVDQIDLSISKTDDETIVEPGQTVTYTITITNDSALDATGVVITETLPVSTTAPSQIGWEQVGQKQVYTYPLGILEAGAVTTTTFAATVADGPFPADLRVLTNTVSAADDGTKGPDQTPDDNTGYDVNALDAAPQLAISKTDGVDEVKPGEALSYTITITNTGNQDATGVVVTDTLPDHTGFITATSPATHSNGVVTWPEFDLAAGDATSTTLAVQLDDAPWPAGVSVITNTVEVADDGTNGFTETVTVTELTAVDAAPDLDISKTNPYTTVVPGGVITYTITITNAGDQDATGVMLTETLPVSTTWVSVAAWQPVSGTNQFTQAVGSLSGGDAAYSTTFVVELPEAPFPSGLDLITNTVSAADDGTNGFTDTVSAAVDNPLDAAPDLVITKTDGVTVVDPGQIVTYTLSVTNLGTQDATNAVITDTLPAAAYTQYVTATGDPSLSGEVLTWPPFDLAVGDHATQTLTVQVQDPDPWPAGVKAITNTAKVADDGSNGLDLNPDDNQVSDVNAITVSPDLFIAKERKGSATPVEPGDLVVYELTYLNKGSQNAAGVVITETTPDFVTYDPTGSTFGWQETSTTGVYTFSLGDLPVGSGGAIDFAVQVSETLSAGLELLTNSVEIADDGTSGPDLNPDDNTDVHQADLEAAPDLVAAKDDRLDVVAPGQLITYTLTISNAGSQGATGVVVTDTLPEVTTFITASHGGEETLGVVIWEWDGELPAGDAFTRTLTVQLPSPIEAGVDAITNTVTVTDDGQNGDDLNPDSNTDTDVNAVEALPIVALFKTDGRTSVKPGDVLTYTLTAKNVGSQDASELILTDTLLVHTTFITASHGADESDGVVVWKDIDLPALGTIERTLAVQVDRPLPPDVKAITNTAEIAGPRVYDTARDVNVIASVVDLILTKDDGQDSVGAGDRLTYTLTVTNAGTVEATGVELSDTLPDHTAFFAASDDGDESDGVVVWSDIDLPAGATVQRTLNVQVARAIPAGVETVTNTATVADDGSYGPDLEPGDNTAQTVTPVEADPALSIGKTDGREAAQAGDVLSYTISLSNTGTQDAASVTVTDTLPDHTTFMAASGGVTPVVGQVTWPPFALAVDEVVMLTLTVQLDQPLPSGVNAVTNTVEAVGDGGVSAYADDVNSVVSAPDLRVVKTDGRVGARPGDTLTYTLVVDNIGTTGATGVVLSDTLPANVTFTEASDNGSHAAGVVTWPEFELQVGTVVTRTVTVEVADPWPEGATPLLTNTATVTDDGLNGIDPAPENNSDTDITHIWLHRAYMPLVVR